MRKLVFTLALMLPILTWGQHVEMMMGENLAELQSQVTQSEIRPGWKISDYQMKDKCVRYLMGVHSTQLTDSRRPVFVITPGEHETLVQYVVMRLKHKRGYRTFGKPKPADNAYLRVCPEHFRIEVKGDDSFVCQPKTPLSTGDYVLMNLDQKPQGDLGDYVVYPFRIEE